MMKGSMKCVRPFSKERQLLTETGENAVVKVTGGGEMIFTINMLLELFPLPPVTMHEVIEKP